MKIKIKTETDRITKALRKRKWHLCKGKIIPGEVHISRTIYKSDEYPKKINICAKCSTKLINRKIDELSRMELQIHCKILNPSEIKPFNAVEILWLLWQDLQN